MAVLLLVTILAVAWLIGGLLGMALPWPLAGLLAAGAAVVATLWLLSRMGGAGRDEQAGREIASGHEGLWIRGALGWSVCTCVPAAGWPVKPAFATALSPYKPARYVLLCSRAGCAVEWDITVQFDDRLASKARCPRCQRRDLVHNALTGRLLFPRSGVGR